ncbi:valine--tRNA ligase [Nanoarchaeota archaeon]
MNLPKRYEAKDVEAKWQKYWEDKDIYKLDTKSKKPVFAIDTPPPTVSGKMHIGHAFSYAQQDFIARFKRMDQPVFYPFGTDDNGLPTERLVEKINKVKSKKMSRDDFIKLCLKTLKETTPNFIADWKKLGISADYKVYYSTIDENSRKISQKSFIDLYKKGEIYKKDFPTVWCPACQTAVAQAELEDKEENSLFSTLKFESEGKDLLIATTRPELLGACVAVFVNPQDKRYKNLIGKKAKVPLFDFEVPVVGDESAQIDKGTGVLMVCSYGDKYDVDAINKHKLKPRLILGADGRIKEGEYENLKVKEARKKTLADLKDKDLIKEQKQIGHAVNVHDKCGTEIEFLPTEQWFIRILDKKKKLVAQGKKIKWYPEFMFKRYKNWVEGLDWDWSISRDRHFGIPMPVWYCCDEIILADEKELPIDPLKTSKKCPKCGEKAKPEQKVLDTWATSSLTPQIGVSLSKGKVKLPLSLRPQAHDIIRTWAFYTITKSLLHENKIPWEDVMISGFVTLKGEKMSKSKGNVIDPQGVLEKYGADALRFWAAASKLGDDLDYQEKDLVTAQRFVTKIWNASKFVFMHLEDFKGKKPKNLKVMDKWLLSKLSQVIKSSTASFEKYEYSKTRAEVEQFFWHSFCDNYLEIVKDRLYNPDKRGVEARESAQYGLYHALLNILKLIAPIMPYITEEIYHIYFAEKEKEKSIHISSWPQVDKKEVDVKAEEAGDLAVEVISAVRKFKASKNLSLKAEISELILDSEIKDFEGKIKLVEDDIKAATHAALIKFSKEADISCEGFPVKIGVKLA